MKKIILWGVIVIGIATAIALTLLQPSESIADVIKEQYLEKEQFNPEDLKSTGTNTWYRWTRNLAEKEDKFIPIKSTTKLQFILEETNTEQSFTVRVKDGQPVVNGKDIAAFLGAEHTFYDESEILQLSLHNLSLVFRGSTAIVYENGVKTPSSATATRVGYDLEVPINVVANGFGYKLQWDEQLKAIHFIKGEQYDK